MTYLSQELSVEDGEVFELYDFTTATSQWKYTTYDQVTDGGFIPLAISREKIQRTENLLKQELSVSVPISSEFGKEIFSSAPEEILSLSVFSQHNGSSEVSLLFIGRLVSIEVKKHEIRLVFEPISTTLKRTGFQAQYQRFCRHTLYGAFCGANPLDHTITGSVTSISGDVVSIDAAGEFSNGYFTAGFIVTENGSKRMVTDHQNSDLTLLRQIPSLVVGSSITVYGGCDHTFNTCKAKFNNSDNYGGFDHIPASNPFGGLTVF